jgi:hypothetical protein
VGLLGRDAITHPALGNAPSKGAAMSAFGMHFRGVCALAGWDENQEFPLMRKVEGEDRHVG